MAVPPTGPDLARIASAKDEAKIDEIYNMLVQEQKSTQAPAKPIPARSVQRPGRNDPCWFGSGRKFKRCHGR